MRVVPVLLTGLLRPCLANVWKCLLVSIAFTGVLAAQAGLTAPRGYRFPRDADYSGDWKAFRAEMPLPFVVRSDFNGDGRQDEVWLLPRSTGRGFGLFAFMSTSSGSPRVVALERDPESEAQGFGVARVNPGRYKTACGKGYWECKRDEPEVLSLKLPSLEFFKFESASSIFWWDRRSASFKRTAISD